MGELHRLLKNRKGSLSVTYKKNAEAYDRAYDMNQKTIQALDTLAEEYSAFEANMKKVTSEHEEDDVLNAMASEVADELERAQKDRGPSARRTGVLLQRHGHRCHGILQGPHKQQQLQKQAAPLEKSAIDVQPMKRSASKLGKRGKEHTI